MSRFRFALQTGNVWKMEMTFRPHNEESQVAMSKMMIIHDWPMIEMEREGCCMHQAGDQLSVANVIKPILVCLI